MADVHSKETRSYNMSRIRSKDTKSEMLMRKFLHKNGFRYRLHKKDLPGKPDIVLPKYRTIIFIHGCFWHGHEGCKYYTIPKTRTEWWLAKINRNKEVDFEAKAKLQVANWKVIEIWTCQLKNSNLQTTLSKVILDLKSS